MHRRIWVAGLAAFALAAVAAASPTAGRAERVVVFAAASLKSALDPAADQWQRESGNQPAISYAASSTLAQQIENGAPAELFISADVDWMDYLEKRNLIDAKSRGDLLGNRLVLVAPISKIVEVTIIPGFPLAKLLGDGRLAIADPAAVPAGKYARASLTRLGVWSTVAGRLAIAENVRAALLLVARNDAPLGIVYQTDARAEPAVKVVGTFPPDSHPPIVFPMALTRMAKPEAAAFAAYLRGPAAGTLFAAHGFTVLERAR